ncbi:hypothetical protein Tco_0156094 [Tanacetum coccineum]
MKASTCTCKKPTMPTRLLSRPSIRRQTLPPGLTMWRRSGGHVPRRLQRPSGIIPFLKFWNDPKNLARCRSKLAKPAKGREATTSTRICLRSLCQVGYGSGGCGNDEEIGDGGRWRCDDWDYLWGKNLLRDFLSEDSPATFRWGRLSEMSLGKVANLRQGKY